MKQLSDVIALLERHPAIARVSNVNSDVGGVTGIEIDVHVSLPTRAQTAGVSRNGIHGVEHCWLEFGPSWPLKAPTVRLRQDFPLDLPHINPHKPGELVSPCLFEGSMHEVLHRFGLEAIIDQLSDWLTKAAAGQLTDLSHGWEPTRRDNNPSTVVFSAEDVIAATPMDGSILKLAADYIAVGQGIHAVLQHTLEPAEVIFSQEVRQGADRWARGRAQVFVVRGMDESKGTPLELSSYQPESVCDLKSFYAQAERLGGNKQQLEEALTKHYKLSVLDVAQEAPSWTLGLFVVVILMVQRPATLVGAPNRNVEVLPYVIHCTVNPKNQLDMEGTAHPAFHEHALSAALLAATSGFPRNSLNGHLVLLGCGSLGSKIAMHLGRAGWGDMAFVDTEMMSPHNAARHAILPTDHIGFPPYKSELMREAFSQLCHKKTSAHSINAVTLLSAQDEFEKVIKGDTVLILDTTASLQLLAAEVMSEPLNSSYARLARAFMYGQGRSVVLMVESVGRTSRVDDLTATIFERCRADVVLRKAVGGDATDPTRVFVGDNCRSLTMPMSDSEVSKAAALVSKQLEKWIVDGIAADGILCLGVEDDQGVGMSWEAVSVSDTVVIQDCGDGWQVRVLAPVCKAIEQDALKWGELETGGALVGHVSPQTKTIIVAGLVDAPSDSVRKRERFILGVDGLVAALRQANVDSHGHLQFVGTWHSHPMGGKHSGLDRNTLKKIAVEAQGWPAVSMVWTPQGLLAEVAQV